MERTRLTRPLRRRLGAISASLFLIAAAAGCGSDAHDTTETVEVTIGEGVSAQPGQQQRGGGGGGTVPAGADPPGNCPNESLDPGGTNLPRIERATVCLLNAIRRERGLGALSRNQALARAATAHSLDMDRRNYFSHVSPEGNDVVDRVRGTGYLPQRGGWHLAENLGWASSGAATAARIVDGWMGSSSHRKNILDGSFNHIGVAVIAGVPAVNARPGATYTTVFGTRSNPAG